MLVQIHLIRQLERDIWLLNTVTVGPTWENFPSDYYLGYETGGDVRMMILKKSEIDLDP